jgi:hypothetical protein
MTHSKIKNQAETKTDELPACAAEYIKLIIKKMHYRQSVREDVKAELKAHFEDELKGYTTQKEREQKARQLITDFGDAKLLAILLHRAKKRCRPLWQTVVVRTFQVIVALIVCFVIYVVWFFTGRPVITTNYLAELNRIVQPATDENQNAAPLYLKAAGMLKELPRDVSSVLSKRHNEITPEEKNLIEGWIADNTAALELVVEGAKRPHYWQEYANKEGTDQMLAVLMPRLSEYRTLAFALRWRAQLHAQQGRYESAFDDLKACYCFGRHLKGSPFLVEQLVGFAIENRATDMVCEILNVYQVDLATLTKLQQDFEKMITGEEFTLNLAGERLFVFDEIQRSFTGGLSGGHIIPKRVAEFFPDVQIIGGGGAGAVYPEKQKTDWLSEFISDIGDVFSQAGKKAKKGGYILFFHPDKRQTYKATQQLYDYWDVLKLKTPGQVRAEGIVVEEEIKKITKGNIFLELMEPAFARCVELGYRNECSSKSLLAVIALMRYKGDNGCYPDNLGELVTAGYLKELPIDPYSNKPLVYKKTDDSFILYSVGTDFADNGGASGKDLQGQVKKWRDNGDTVFWPIPKPEVSQP